MQNRSRVPAVSMLFVTFSVLLVIRSHVGGSVPSMTQTSRPEICTAKPEPTFVLQEFSAGRTYGEMEEARRRLMNTAKLSAECRMNVIATILQVMDKPELDIYQDFNLWRYGSRLLGDLNATEGLDLLIKHLSFTDGTSINVAHYPAMQAVIKIGRPAIPKLGAALRQNSATSYRFNAVFCIAQIGGPTAITELRTALASESDSCVRKFIQVSINVLDNTRAPGQITAEDRTKWFAALSCHE